MYNRDTADNIMAKKKKYHKAKPLTMQEILQRAKIREERAMEELNASEGPYSKETYEWVLEQGLNGEREAQLLYFNQVAQGFVEDFDWELLEEWAQAEVQRNPGEGYLMLATMYSPVFPGPVDLTKAILNFRLGEAAGNEVCKECIQNLPEEIEGGLAPLIEEFEENPLRASYYMQHLSENVDEAFKSLKLWYEKSPDDAECLEQMGICYANGLGVKENNSQALKFYCMAADKGSAMAQFYAGEMYLQGLGCRKNYKAAIAYLEKAVAQDFPPACCLLGNCYEDGNGVKVNKKKAIALYEKGVGLENVECCCLMALACAEGTVQAPNMEKAWEYVRKAEQFADEDDSYTAQKISRTYARLRHMQMLEDEDFGIDALEDMDDAFFWDDDEFSEDDLDDMDFWGEDVMYTEEQAAEDYKELIHGMEEGDETAIYFRLVCGLERAAEEPRFREAAWKVLNEKMLGDRLQQELIKELKGMARESACLCLLCGDLSYLGIGVKARLSDAFRYYEQANVYQDSSEVYLRMLLGYAEKRWPSGKNKEKTKWIAYARSCEEEDCRLPYLLGLMYATGCVRGADAADAQEAFAQAKAWGMERNPEPDVTAIKAGMLSYRECVLPQPSFPEMDS